MHPGGIEIPRSGDSTGVDFLTGEYHHLTSNSRDDFMRFIIIASALLALAACASNEPAKPAVAAAAPAASGVVVADAQDKVVCRRVQGMGELVTHTKCEKQSDIDLHNQESLQEAGRAQQAAHMHAVPGSGS